MRIGIDLDGVVYDFTGALREHVHITTGRSRESMPDPTCWEFYAVDWGMTLDEYLDFARDGVESGGVFSFGVPMSGAVETMTRLKDAGHTLHIVTARGLAPRAFEKTCSWLRRHKVPFDTLTFAEDKTVVKLDAFIDDRPKNVDELRAAGVAAFLLECNRGDQWGHKWKVADWGEFERAVELLAHPERPGDPAFDPTSEAEAPLRREPFLVFPRGEEVRVVNETTGGEKGQKLARFDLLPWDALTMVAEHFGIGARKYEDRNWERGYSWSLSLGALGRHFAAFMSGEDIDPETQSPHMAAVAFHALAVLRFMVAHPELDDRGKVEDEVAA